MNIRAFASSLGKAKSSFFKATIFIAALFLLLGQTVSALTLDEILRSQTGQGSVKAAVTVTLQQGVNGYNGVSDAFIQVFNTASNAGSDDRFLVRQSNEYKGLIKFNLSSIPAGATISSANLELYLYDPNRAESGTMNVYRIMPGRNWVENQVNWTQYISGSNWSAGGLQSGGDYAATPVASWSIPSADVAGWKSFSITSAVQAWVNGTENNGLIFSIPDAPYFKAFRSSNYTTDITLRPKLTITYDDGGITPPPTGDTQAPTVSLSAPSAGSSVSGSITFSANASDNVGVSGVQFKLDGSNLGSEDTSAPYSLSWNTAQAANGSHTLTATARDAAGLQTTSSGITVTVNNATTDTQAPTVPANLSATAMSSSQINLSWTASTDNVGVTGYRIYRNGSQIATSNTTSYSNTGLAASTSYTYTVSAYDGANNVSGQSNAASATTASGTVTPPPSGTIATVHGMNIPAAHPRIWWNAERLQRAKTWYQSHPFTPGQGGGANAEAQNVALDNALLYVLTDNTTNARNAINYAMGVTMGTAGVASDPMRWFGEIVILIYDWTYDQMTPTERETLRTRWNGYIDYWRQQDWGGPHKVESNYNWGYARNMFEWGVATYGENTMADTFLNDAIVTRWQNNFYPYANSAPGGRGGIFTEGSNYGVTMGDYPIVPFISASLLGRDLYRETNYFRDAVFYTIYATTPARTYHRPSGNLYYEMFPFADDQRFVEGGYVINGGGWGSFMNTAANYWKNQPVGQYARKWFNTVAPKYSKLVAAVDEGGSELDFSSLPLDYYGPGLQYLYGRNAWGPQSTTFQLQIGDTHIGVGGHDHNDMGNWQMWRNGRWLSRETTGYSNSVPAYGGGAGVDTNNAAAHNVLFVNGRATSGYNVPDPAVTRLESRPEYSYLVANMTPAYNDSTISQVYREFLFIRPLETMVIFDRIGTTDTTGAKGFIAHFEQNPSIDQANRVINGVNGDQALRVSTLLPANPTYRTVTEGGTVGQYRVEIETSGSAQTYFLNVLQAKGATDPNLTSSLVDNGSSYTVTLSHPTRGTVTLTLNKGMTSSGGSITVAGQSYDLLSRVQGITVSDNGPVWENLSGGTTPTTPVISSFTASPSSITSGQSSTLSWSVSNATSLSINQSIGTVTGSSRSVSPTNTTTYTLTATNSSGSVTANATVTVTAATDTQAPTVPANLTATAMSSSQINLAWTASTDNVGVTGYRIYRNGTQIATASTNSYQNTGLNPSTSYTYTVAAYDAVPNVSAQSNAASATTASGSTNTTPPTGYLDGVRTTDGVAFGWAHDSDNLSVPIEVHFYIDNNAGTSGATPAGYVSASEYRSDVGNHAFNWSIPAQYRNGQSHQIWAWAIDLTNPANNRQVIGSPVTFTLGTVTPPPPSGSATGFFPTPQTQGETTFTLHPVESVTPNQPTRVSFGVPFPKGYATNLNNIRILDANRNEKSIFIKTLTPWRNMATGADEQSIRSAFVQMDVTFNGPVQFIVEWGRNNRTQPALTEVPVRNTWVQVNDTRYPASHNVYEPRAIAMFSSQWYGDSVIKTRMQPQGTNSDFSLYDQVLPGFTDTMINPSRVPYLTTYDNWLFDRAMSLYQAAFRTGNVTYMREAHRAAQFYANHINTAGFFDMKDGDMKYVYGESLNANYWLTGDDRLPGIHQRMLNAFRDSQFNPSSTSFWTERNAGYKLLGYVTAFELLGNVSAADTAQSGDTVSQRAREIFDILVSRQANSNPNLGCIMHSRDSHEGDGRPEMISSSWMSTLMIDAVERYYIHSGDSRVSNFVKRYADCWSLANNMLYRTQTTDYTRDLTLAYYLGPYTIAQDQQDPWNDIQHATDVSKIHALAYYFTRLEGNPNANYLNVFRDLHAAGNVNFNQYVGSYGLNPVRKYNWWFRTTTNNDWLIGGSVSVPTTPVISSFTASPSSITSGQSSTLSWSVSGATSLSINQSIGTVTGSSRSVSPTNTTTYTLTASNSAGSVTANVTVNVTAADGQAPTVPANLTATAMSSSQINLSWTASTDNVGVTGYRIYRNGSQIATSNTTSYQNTGLSASTSYTYTVAAYDGANNVSGQSNAATATTPSSSNIGSIYVSSTGNDANACTQAAPCRQIRRALQLAGPGSTIYVGDGQYQAFDINGLNGTASQPITIQATGSGAVVNPCTATTSPSCPGRRDERNNIDLYNSSYIVVDGLQAQGSGRAGISIKESHHVTVRNGRFWGNNRWGIFTDFAPDVVIENNEAFNSVTQHGIYVSNSLVPNENVIVRNNLSYGNAQNGIQFNGDCNWYTSTNVKSDGVLSGNIIENNIVRDNGNKGLSLISFSDSIVRNNLIYNNGLSGGAGGIHFADEIGGAVPCGLYSNNNTVVNNTVVEPRVPGIQITHGNNNTFFNNISVSSQAYINDGSGNLSHTGSNLYRTSSSGLFTNAAGNDYHLVSGSPAVGVGVATYNGKNAPSTDISGAARPQGGTYDSGAYEFAGTTPTTPVISSFTASPSSITSGQSSTLSWSVSGATSLSINQGVGTVTGTSRSVSPTNTTTYTLTATNSSGSVTANATVTVTAATDTQAPTVPANLSATAMSSSQINLAWTASTDNVGVTGYRIYRNGSQIATSNTTSYQNTGLAASTSYTYTVAAYDGANNVSGQSNAASATTQAPPDTTAPAISGVSVTNLSQTSATISFVTNEPATHQVQYGVSTSYGLSSPYTTSAGTSHTISLSGLSAGTVYNYQVRAKDLAQNEAISANYTFTTQAAPVIDSTAPSSITNLAFSAVSQTSAVLSFTAPGDDNTSGTAASYDIRYSTSPINANSWNTATQVTGEPIPAAAGTSQSYTLVGLAAKTRYYAAIKTADEVPNWSNLSNVVNFTTKKGSPRSATNLTAALGSIILSWQLPSDSADLEPRAVTVRRTTGSSPAAARTEGAAIYDGPAVTTVTDQNVQAGATYTYTVFVYESTDPTNISAPSYLTVTLPASGGQPQVTTPPAGGAGGTPTVPSITNFKAEGLDAQVALSWTNPSDVNFVRVRLVRKEGSAPTSAQDGQVIYEGSQASFIDTSLSNGRNYHYGAFVITNAGPAANAQAVLSATPAAGRTQSNIINPVNVQTRNRSGLRLINQSGTFYLVSGGQRRGITNPGMLNTYGFTFAMAKPATTEDLALPEGSLLLPGDGALVKSVQDPTVYLISQGQRYGFTSAQVFASLGHKFSSVLVVTNPELQALPKADNLQNPAQAHLPGTDVNYQGTVYWINLSGQREAYPSLTVYNSWHLPNDFTRVVPANQADLSLPLGGMVSERVVE